MKTWLVKFIATFGFVGYLPIAPGTWASALAALLYFGMPTLAPQLLVAFMVAGYAVTGEAEKVFQKKDPGVFVMDEVAGMMLALLGLPLTGPVILAAFLLFRFFDVVKPWPICLIQKMKSPLSIMHDDLAAGLATNFIIHFFTIRSLLTAPAV